MKTSNSEYDKRSRIRKLYEDLPYILTAIVSCEIIGFSLSIEKYLPTDGYKFQYSISSPDATISNEGEFDPLFFYSSEDPAKQIVEQMKNGAKIREIK